MTIQPRGSGERRQLALTRRKVKFNPVTSRLCGGVPRTGYLRVSTFSKQTAEGVGAAIQELKVRPRARAPAHHSALVP
jgi:C-terminal processing protease CtpA/Prc